MEAVELVSSSGDGKVTSGPMVRKCPAVRVLKSLWSDDMASNGLELSVAST